MEHTTRVSMEEVGGFIEEVLGDVSVRVVRMKVVDGVLVVEWEQ